MNLARLRRRAAWGYWAESLLRAAAPGCGILAAYIIAVLFGFANPWAWVSVLVLAVLAFGFGFSRVRRPGVETIDRRIERASGLRHRPLAMLEDEPENDGELTAAIWNLHQLQIASSLRNARAGKPFIDAVAHDPWALRGALLLLLLTGAIIAGPQAIPRLGGAFAFPEFTLGGPTLDAWATEPAYTGQPPLVLQPGKTYPVLAGTGITVVVNGLTHPPATMFGGKKLAFGALAQTSFRSDAVLTASAKLRIGPWWHPMASWNFVVSPPEGPAITLGKFSIRNRQLIIGWQAADRYGLASLIAVLTPLGHPGAPPEQLPLSVADLDPHHQSGTAAPDIGDSPYAGLPVKLVLTARNLAGVEGSSAPVTLVLPPPDLHDKTAAALAALRQNLALAPGQRQAAGEDLSKLAQSPLSKISASADVQMAALAGALSAGEMSATDAQNLLDRLSHEVESGPDYQPGLAFAAAARALEQALRQAAATGKPIDANRLQSLLAAMQSALAQHLQALGPKNSGTPGNGAGSMSPADLNQLASQIAQDEASGQTAKAQAELQRLQQMLAALQSAKPMTAADAARAAAAAKAAEDLARMMKDESSLLDQTNNGSATPGGQAAVQNQLGATSHKLGQAGIFPPGLDDAAAAMATAQSALARQDETAAAGAEGAAIQGLQKAAAALAASRGMSFDAGGASGGSADSLENGTSGGPDETGIRTILPSAGNAAAAIQRQIIKNDADPALPAATHQYYHRLLNADGQ